MSQLMHLNAANPVTALKQMVIVLRRAVHGGDIFYHQTMSIYPTPDR